MNKETERRLAKTCFRGRDKALAGNTVFNNFEWLLHDKYLFDAIRSACRSLIRTKQVVTGRKTIEVEHPARDIGWPAHDRREHYSDDDLESYQPNDRSTALCVRRDAGFRAYPTRRLTIACEIKREDRKWLIFVHTVYPGDNIGPLEGNITERKNIVFFHWDNPGDRLDDIIPTPTMPAALLHGRPAPRLTIYRSVAR